MAHEPVADDDFEEMVCRYVVAASDSSIRDRYGDLLHGNFVRLPGTERSRFLRGLGRDARQVTDADLELLLDPLDGIPGWRERITAAWLIGLSRRTRFREVLGRLLLDSDLVYAGQGYCFALARFGQPQDADILTAYLDRYLPQRNCHYDQDWALGGLLHLDADLGTGYAEEYLVHGGLWGRSSFSGTEPAECLHQMTTLIGLADEAMRTSG